MNTDKAVINTSASSTSLDLQQGLAGPAIRGISTSRAIARRLPYKSRWAAPAGIFIAARKLANQRLKLLP